MIKKLSDFKMVQNLKKLSDFTLNYINSYNLYVIIINYYIQLSNKYMQMATQGSY